MYVSVMSLDQGITQLFLFHFLCAFVYELKFISGRSGDSLVLVTLFVVLLSRDLNLTSPFSIIYLCKKYIKIKFSLLGRDWTIPLSHKTFGNLMCYSWKSHPKIPIIKICFNYIFSLQIYI